MFGIRFVFKPIIKFFIAHPLLGALMLLLIYLYIARRCALSAWEFPYAKTPTKEEIAARWLEKQG